MPIQINRQPSSWTSGTNVTPFTECNELSQPILIVIVWRVGLIPTTISFPLRLGHRAKTQSQGAGADGLLPHILFAFISGSVYGIGVSLVCIGSSSRVLFFFLVYVWYFYDA